MQGIKSLAVVLACGAAAVEAAVAQDEVKSLPGWDQALPSRHYSGFLTVDKEAGRALHYYFVEAHTNSSKAPFVLWMNGGPGCSSLDGLLYEHGPLLVNADGTKLVENPFAWSTLANVLYLEAPAGVGFSYSNTSSDYTTGDNKTAYDNFEALKVFFSKYPEFSQNEFYVSGESYGGIYVPTLSYVIFKNRHSLNFNMKGFLVGNGVFGQCEEEDKLPTDAHTEFLHGHGIVSESLYRKTVKACEGGSSAQCLELTQKANSFSRSLNMYDAYRTCYHHTDEAFPIQAMHKNPFLLRELRMLRRPAHPAVQLSEQVPCIDSTGATKYLARQDVKTAIHVLQSPNTWAICSDIVNYKNDGVYSSMVPLYKEMSPTYRIVVYNGNVDPGCNYIMNELCVASVQKEVKNDWRTWYFDSKADGRQVGGWTTEYAGDLHFITIHGAGHMSPQWKPDRVHTMLGRFLSYKPF